MPLPSNYDSWLTDDHYTERCDRCEVKSDDLIEIEDGYFVCSDCLENYFECSECHSYHDLDDMSEVSEVCNQCFEDSYVECKICGKPFNADKVVDFNEHSPVCELCRRSADGN